MVEAPIRCCATQGSTGRPATAGRQLASRADQTSERGLWARAYHTAERPSSSPSTAWQLLVDVEARYQCRMQHDWSRRGCQAVRKSPSGSRRARLERRRPTWTSTALEPRRDPQDSQSIPIVHAGETRAVDQLPEAESESVRLFLADDTFRAGRREK